MIFLLVLVPYRMAWRYGTGGCRDLLIEPGHLSQNLYLACEAIGCVGAAVTDYRDNQINDLIGIDGINQLIIMHIHLARRNRDNQQPSRNNM